MSKNIKIFVYVAVSLFIAIFFLVTFVSVQASYGGLKLNFVKKRLIENFESNYSLDVKVENIVLKRENTKGFYFEFDKLQIINKNNLELSANSINWDFNVLNLLTFSIDKNNKFVIQDLIISNSDFKVLIDEIDTSFDKFGNLELLSNEMAIRFPFFDYEIKLNNNVFNSNTELISDLLKSEINFRSNLSVNDEIYQTEIQFTPETKQINIIKFIGNNFYMNSDSFIKYDNILKTAQIKFDIKSTKKPIIKYFRLNKNSKAFPMIDGFRGWQSILLETSSNYSNGNFFSNLLENINLKISGIYELSSLLPKNELYTNFGNVTNYEIEFYNEFDKHVIHINNIKKGSFFKVNKELDNANVNLVTSIDKNAAINFLKTTILSRESDTGRVVNFLEKNLNKKNDVILNFNINPTSMNVIKSLKNLYVIASGKLNTEFIFDDNINPNFISGAINYYIEIKNLESSTPQLMGQIDLTGVNAYIRQINLEKNDNTTLKIQFEGDTNSLNDSLIKFDSLDSEIDFSGQIKITKTNHIFLENLLINNKSNVVLNLSGDLSERVLNLEIKGDIIDLSKNRVETKKREKTYYLVEENYSIITENVIFAGSVQVNDFRAVIEKRGPKLSVNSQAISNEHELNYSREKSDDVDVNIINSSDITYFVNNNHPARKLLSDGEFKMTSIRNLDTQIAKVNIDLQDFVLINTPASLKLLSLPSISGLVSIAEGEQGIRFGYGELNYSETKNEFSDIEAFAVSDSLGLILDGNINRKKKTIDMKGEISPMHLVNAIIQKLPILGPIMAGGEGEGMFSIDFTMTGSSEDPEVESNPLTIIKPRIIERAIEALDNSITTQ